MVEYKNYEDLRSHEAEDKDYKILYEKKHPEICVIAVHSGGIEGGTGEIAKEIAQDVFTFYSFSGIKQSGNIKLHITSNNFDEPICEDIVRNSMISVSVHGEDSQESVCFIGGLDKKLIELMTEQLNVNGFKAIKDNIRPGIAGTNAKNVVNRSKRGIGVQLEISEGMRDEFFVNWRKRVLRHPRPESNRFQEFCRIIRNCISEYYVDLIHENF